ncbi:MAG: DUF3179 domain-containing protein [Planctomycetes bacterium]|nr:DUF3179 domain-containing protein [Planctomycetota bacterium]
MTKQIFKLITVVSLIMVCFFSIFSWSSGQADTHDLFTPCKDSSLFSDEEFFENAVGGGPLPDGIPPHENPTYESVASASEWLDESDRVFVVESQEGVRLYPQPIMVWHEIVNSRFNGRAGALTYCPLVGVAIGYYTDFNEPETTFGTSGKLVNNNLIMYDRQTGSYWPQILGEAITGPLSTLKLEAFPVYWAQWADAAKAYPDAEVLSRDTGFFKPYGFDPYGNYPGERGYYFTDRLLFSLMHVDGQLGLKELIIGIKTACGMAALPKNSLTMERPVLNLTVADAPVVVFYDEALDTVRTFSRVSGDTVLTFALRDGNFIDLNSGSVWTKDGHAISGKWAGSQLNWIESMESFWFAWIAFYPETQFISIDTIE